MQSQTNSIGTLESIQNAVEYGKDATFVLKAVLVTLSRDKGQYVRKRKEESEGYFYKCCLEVRVNDVVERFVAMGETVGELLGMSAVAFASHEQNGEIDALQTAFQAIDTVNLVGRKVRASHDKLCTDCSHKFSLSNEWYWTDTQVPWGADKFCDNCMAMKLGGVYVGDEDEDGDY